MSDFPGHEDIPKKRGRGRPRKIAPALPISSDLASKLGLGAEFEAVKAKRPYVDPRYIKTQAQQIARARESRIIYLIGQRALHHEQACTDVECKLGLGPGAMAYGRKALPMGTDFATLILAAALGLTAYDDDVALEGQTEVEPEQA